MTAVDVRRAGAADVREAVLALFDANVEWLVAHGREGQWGEEPWTGDAAREAFVDDLLGRGEVRVGAADGVDVAGVLVLGADAPPYVDPAGEPERYVHLLIADPRVRGGGVGAALLSRARELTATAGVDLLRVDCWAGGDGRLVAYYESQGFRRTSAFDSDGWIGQVLELRVG